MHAYSHNFPQTNLQIHGKATEKHIGLVSEKTDRQTYTATHGMARIYKGITDFKLCPSTDSQVI
jgi:hypothetical protein